MLSRLGSGLACFLQNRRVCRLKKMDKNEDQPNKVSTCFEGSPLAERMQQIMDEEGIGSLSHELMRSLLTMCGGDKDKPRSSEKKEGRGSKE